MFTGKKKRLPRGDGNGLVWIDSGIGTPSQVRDVFGPRLFPDHIASVGYDYDFHRGIDTPGDLDNPTYAPINGTIIRLHNTHYGWQHSRQLSKWRETDPNSSVQFNIASSSLGVTGSRVGTQTFAQAGYYAPVKERIIHDTGWTLETEIQTGFSASGYLGIGVVNDFNSSEFVCLEYDGTTFRITGSNRTTALNTNGQTYSAASKTWLRITHTSASNLLSWRHSTDGDTFTEMTSSSGNVFTSSSLAVFKPVLYWRSTDTSASPSTASVKQFNWIDNQTIDRFGNWMTISDGTKKAILMHFRDFTCDLGDCVSAGEIIGYVGRTGFDTRSGRINTGHVHTEICPNTTYTYDSADAVNPLSTAYFPRANVSNNVTVNRTISNDPDGVSSHLLAITASRADQDFDINVITLTGSTTSRSINWNTRSGLNADVDIPKESGVYIVAHDFNGDSTSFKVSVYFNRATVGNDFVAAIIKDADDRTLWNE